ncbi:MAG: hypothetical protein ACPG9R_03765, partial [Marinobacter salsuginis]
SVYTEIAVKIQRYLVNAFQRPAEVLFVAPSSVLSEFLSTDSMWNFEGPVRANYRKTGKINVRY